MTSHGSKIHCPSCGTPHVVRVGEVKAQRQVEFLCSACGAAISIASDTAQAAESPTPPSPTKPQIHSVE